MIAPGPKLVACLEVLSRATLEARLLGWDGEREGLARDKSKQLRDLMDAVHNIPGLAVDWERCDEQLLRGMLGDYDQRHGGHLLAVYDRVVAEQSRSS